MNAALLWLAWAGWGVWFALDSARSWRQLRELRARHEATRERMALAHAAEMQRLRDLERKLTAMVLWSRQ